MTYVICERCRLRTFSASLHALCDACPRCGGPVASNADSPARFKRSSDWVVGGGRNPRLMLVRPRPDAGPANRLS